MTKSTERKSNYWISGFRIAQAKKVAEFFFGDFFIKCTVNPRKGTFNILIHESLTIKVKETENSISEKMVTPEEYIPMDYFKRYWGPQWVITKINEKDLDKI